MKVAPRPTPDKPVVEPVEDAPAESVDLDQPTSSHPLRTVAIIAVICAFFGLIFAGLTAQPDPAGEAWNLAMTTGPDEAKSHYIMYTDLMCPYCDVFSRAVTEHWDEFQDYLAEHKILFEVRMTDLIYEGHDSAQSRVAGEASYCAARQGKFWDFYHAALTSLWDDYHSKGIGSSKTAPPITDMPDDYWVQIGREAGLDSDGSAFADCVANHEALDELDNNTRRASLVSNGLPSFKFNKFTTSGFSETWDWTYVQLMLDAGLSKS